MGGEISPFTISNQTTITAEQQMTHFTCLVVGNNPEKQLAPFQENNMGDCPEEYLEFFDVTEECQAKYQENNQGYSSFESFMAEYEGYKNVDPRTLKYGRWVNPNARWDWYVLGGRWKGYFLLKDGRQSDSGLKKDVDWMGMIALKAGIAKENYARFEEYQKQPDFNGTKAWFEFAVNNIGDNKNYIPETKEQFMARQSSLATYAVLKDGVWREREGSNNDKEMTDKWNSEFRKLIESINDDTLLSVYDCHI